ncbi:hypothetical protein HZB04_04155 [Candidatus Wolfebacteria bacterium]|nr:hypothetical protein [Candidatus Wolfebacteria bacterium]
MKNQNFIPNQFSMEKQPSWPIKIAAFLLLVGGLLDIFAAASRLVVSLSNPNVTADLRAAVNQISQIIAIGWNGLSILAGWYLIKLKRWAYILSLVLTSLALAMHLLALTQVGATRYFNFLLSIAILIVLIISRKKFKKQ